MTTVRNARGAAAKPTGDAAKSVIAKTHDPANYQYSAPGAPDLQVETMSRDDLMQALCQTIDVIERFDGINDVMQSVVRGWRQGRPADTDLTV